MTTKFIALRSSSSWTYWPYLAAGFLGPLLGSLLSRWLPFHFAIGIAFFVTWLFVGIVLVRASRPRWGIPAWVAAVIIATTTGFWAGALAFFFPWK